MPVTNNSFEEFGIKFIQIMLALLQSSENIFLKAQKTVISYLWLNIGPEPVFSCRNRAAGCWKKIGYLSTP